MAQQNQAADPARRFRFDKTVNLGHIITTAAMIVSLFVWGSAIDRRLAIVEEKARTQATTDAHQDQTVQDAVILLRGELQHVADKLDRLLENQAHR